MMLPQWQGVALAQESASISGTVTDENGAPIEGIKVTAYRQVVDTESQMISWLPSGGSLATSEGIYNINVGQGGVFHIHFADTVFPPRYAPEYYVDSNAVWFGVDIVVNDRENFSGVDAMLLFGSSITGKVTDINGTPIENALVNAYRPIDNGGGYTSYEYAGEVTVGADGS